MDFIMQEKRCRMRWKILNWSEIEKETIRRHMFPLNPIPPCCREAWIVTLADKICSGGETVEGFWEKFEEIRNPL